MPVWNCLGAARQTLAWMVTVMLPTTSVRTQENFPVRSRAGSMNTERGEEALVRQLKQIGAERYR